MNLEIYNTNRSYIEQNIFNGWAPLKKQDDTQKNNYQQLYEAKM